MSLTYNPDGTISYLCGDCGRTNCKLWREYQTFLSNQTLRCAECALKNQRKEGPVDAQGCHPDDFGKTNQIGWLVPAAITLERDTFWGVTSTPQEIYEWWTELPT